MRKRICLGAGWTKPRAAGSLALAAALVLAAGPGCRTAATGAPRPAVAPKNIPRSLQAFVASVEVLPERFEPREPRLARSLHELAGAVPDLSQDPDVRLRSRRLALLADELSSARTPEAAAGAADAALMEAVGVLQGATPAGAARSQLDRARTKLDQLDHRQPLPAQSAAVRQVLGAVANGLLLSLGADPVLPESFGEAPAPSSGASPASQPASQPASPAGTGPGGSPAIRGADVEAAAASERVARLSELTGRDARTAAADALDAFLRTLEALGLDGAALRRTRSDVRFQAERLRSTDDFAFESGEWARKALLAIVGGVAAVPVGRTETLSGWLARARDAARGVEADAWFPFQRSRLQEAFRSVADALLAAADASRGRAARDGRAVAPGARARPSG